MDVNDIRSLIHTRSNNGFLDVTVKLTDIEDFFNVVEEMKMGGFLIGLRTPKSDHLYISWGRENYFKPEWWHNLQKYLEV